MSVLDRVRVEGSEQATTPEAPAPKLVPRFTSTQEAEKWAQQNLHASLPSLKGVRMDYAQSVLDSIYDMEQRAAQPFTGRLEFGGIKGKEYAHFDSSANALRFRKTADPAEVVERMRLDDATWRRSYDAATPFHAVSDMEGLVRHEYGHAIDNASGNVGSRMVQALSVDEKQQLLRLSGYSGEDMFVGGGTSGLKGREAFAEAYAAIASGSDRAQLVPGTLAQYIRGLLK